MGGGGSFVASVSPSLQAIDQILLILIQEDNYINKFKIFFIFSKLNNEENCIIKL